MEEEVQEINDTFFDEIYDYEDQPVEQQEGTNIFLEMMNNEQYGLPEES